MSTETNKTIVKGYFDKVWNNGRLDLVEEFITENFDEDNIPQIPGLNGRESLKAIIGGAQKSLPDIQIVVNDIFAEGNKVATSWTMNATHQGEFMGVPATGKELTQTGAAIFRLANGKIAEIWNFPDNLGLMQQLGLIPTPEPA